MQLTPAIWIALENLRLAAAQPSSWVIWVLLFLCWPLWSAVSPIGISSQYAINSDVLYNLAIVSFALGALRGLGTLAELSRSIAQISSGPSLSTRMLAVGSVGLLHVLIAWAPAVLMGSLGTETHAPELGAKLASAFLAIVALGSLLLRLDLAAGAAAWLMGIAILVAPLLLPDPLPARSLIFLSAALLSASWLLDHPPGRAT
ncbi:MAG: hypothetical protein ACKVXR_06105 [Planctomycetota bacterium]